MSSFLLLKIFDFTQFYNINIHLEQFHSLNIFKNMLARFFKKKFNVKFSKKVLQKSLFLIVIKVQNKTRGFSFVRINSNNNGFDNKLISWQ